MLLTLFIADDVNLDHLAEAVFARCLHCKLTFLTPFHIITLERSHNVCIILNE